MDYFSDVVRSDAAREDVQRLVLWLATDLYV